MIVSRRFCLSTLVVLGGLAASALPAFAQGKPLRVFAASSLTDAMNEIGGLFSKEGHPRPIFIYNSSSTLARQIEQGAPADLFISADEPWMDYLAERKLIEPSSRKSVLSNRLVLIAPRDRPLNLKIGAGMDLMGALKGGKLAMGDPDGVPAGRYGRAALQSLGIWNQVEGSVARTENVRAAINFVARGEANAGIVYLTDQMAAAKDVTLVGEFPPTSYPQISYPLAVVRGGATQEAAKFEAFLLKPSARAAFARLGFVLK